LKTPSRDCRLGGGAAPVRATGSAARRLATAADTPASERTLPIDLDTLRVAGLLPPAHQERELAQQFRQIKRPLINSALGRGVEALPEGNLVRIASDMPEEGNTFTSLKLATRINLEEDVTVLLVTATSSIRASARFWARMTPAGCWT
jgi:hypothetical protein